MVRLKVLGLAVAMAVGLASAPAANAAPFGYGPAGTADLIERVAGGCGPGFHPNRWGECRPHFRDGYGRGYGGPRGFYGDRTGYGYRGGYGGGYDRGYDRPRRFYDGY